MAGASGLTASTGGGGLDAGSSAASTSGDVKHGNRAYGGINIAPGGGSGFSIPPMTIAIGVGLVAIYFVAKKKNYI